MTIALKVQNQTDTVKYVRARVERSGEFHDTKFAVMPRSIITLHAEVFFDLRNNALSTPGLRVLEVTGQEDTAAAKPQTDKPTLSKEVQPAVTSSAPAAETAAHQKSK